MSDPASFARIDPARPRKLRGPAKQFVLDAFAASRADKVRLVQVGANDGQMADPVYPYIAAGGWEGLLIEPHPIYFAELKALHAPRPELRLRNLAISEEAGRFDLFHLNEAARDRYPKGLRGCASLERARMIDALERGKKRKAVTVREDDIAVTQVTVMRLDAVLAEEGIDRADILVIDVEGHERQVLRSFDLGKLGPALVVVECNGIDIGNEAEIVTMMNEGGLVVRRFGDDLIGLRPGAVQVPLEAILHFLAIDPISA